MKLEDDVSEFDKFMDEIMKREANRQTHVDEDTRGRILLRRKENILNQIVYRKDK